MIHTEQAHTCLIEKRVGIISVGTTMWVSGKAIMKSAVWC